MIGLGPVSIATTALTDPARGVRARSVRGAIEWASAGFRCAQLGATGGGLRPAQMDRSARRDLAAMLRRAELAVSGLDLFIPPEHFAESARVDRAVGAVIAAAQMIAEVAPLANAGPGAAGGRNDGRIVCITLHPDLAADALREVTGACDRLGVRLADHAWPRPESASGASLGVGIDPATLLIAGTDPAQAVLEAKDDLVSARLSDLARVGRVAPGDSRGRLDLAGYAASLIAAGYAAPVVLDTAGLREPEAGAERARDAWLKAASIG